jgi:COP9 signalosome complex subunit 2
VKVSHDKFLKESSSFMRGNIEQWDDAQTDFFESFKNYDEAGSPQRIQVLK